MKSEERIDRLIAGYLDGTLSESEKEEFEQMILSDPVALERAGEAVSFDMALADAVNPNQLEFMEQRRVVIDVVSGKPVTVEKIHRIGPPQVSAGGVSAGAKSKGGWWLLTLPFVVMLVAGIIWLGMKGEPQAVAGGGEWGALPLKNPGFEEPELSEEQVSSLEIVGWQDKFTTGNARVIGGEVRSGRQSVELAPGGHIKQLLYERNGKVLTFEPGRRLRVSGWVKAAEPVSGRADILHVALHYVDEESRQYVVHYGIEPIDGSGWRRFTRELIVPEQETFEPSYAYGVGEVAAVRGRQILLSVTNISYQMSNKVTLLLDDMEVEVLESSRD